MPITVQCPNPACGVISPADEVISGRTVRCKKCGQPFVAKPTLDGQQHNTKQNQPSSNTNPFPVLPAEFGRYRVLQLLGKGGMGAVYLAEDSHLGRQVALKMLYLVASESPQRVERFVREARSAAILQHPNICTVFDAGQIDDRPFLTMMYIAGKSLEDEIDPDAPLPQIRAAEIARKIALALDHAHRKGIVHRDLKPANVMMTAEDEPVVMDFGLAKRVAEGDPNEAKLTREGGILGTPTYMSPEQVKGQVEAIGPATDIYSLGVMLFEMLTGNPPYIGPVWVVMGQIVSAPVPQVSEFRTEVDVQLEAICFRAMAKDPAARFPSMVDLATALSEYLKDPNISNPLMTVTIPVTKQVDSEPAVSRISTDDWRRNRRKKKKVQTTTRGFNSKRWKRKWSLVLGWIAAGLLGLLVAASIVVVARTKHGDVAIEQGHPTGKIPLQVEGETVRTQHGEVVIQLNDPAANVAVQVDGRRIDVIGLNKPLTLTVGEHYLTVSGRNFETITRSFTVKKSEKQKLTVTLRPKTEIATNNPSTVNVAEKQETVITNSIGMKLAYIPPGKFSMGSRKEEKGFGEDEEQHEVEISMGFYLGVYEVTQGEYENIMGENPSYFSAKGIGKDKVLGDTSRFPVEMVSYEDARTFCERLSQIDGEKQKKRVYRLPTEAEWEYSCRGGAPSKTPFHYGQSLSSNQANFNGNYPYGDADKGTYLERTCKVGSYQPNGYGLYDMHGNVYEWCSDWYGKNYYSRSAQRDPQGPSEVASHHVFRGGSWYSNGLRCRSANRISFRPPSQSNFDLGFRVVLAASPHGVD